MKAFAVYACVGLFALLWVTSKANQQAEKLQELILPKRSSKNNNRVEVINSWWDEEDEVLKEQYHVLEEEQEGLRKADKIRALPGQPNGVNFDQYSGYVTVDPKAGRALFYYFVESPQSPSTKPLVLWLNGGPGCSSLGYGAMEELGPFRVNSNGKTLFGNKYAWNKVANVLFLESPAGVGFSYSNTSSDYDQAYDQARDKFTANDAYVFLINWLERFPQYKSRDFFITGESYVGRYGPQLADTILFHNKQKPRTIINLKGIATGNALTDDATILKGMFDFFRTHTMTSDETHAAIDKHCDFVSGNFSNLCVAATVKFHEEKGGIDGYNIYAPRCHKTSFRDRWVYNYDPSSGYSIHAYMNNPEVQLAIHALPTNWTQLIARVDYNRIDRPSTILPIIKNLITSAIEFGSTVWIHMALCRSQLQEAQEGFKKADKIRALPGQPRGVNFDQYSGYVTVDPKAGRALFYYFVESPYNSSTKPLVLWLNGGPGCSSLGYGAMQELGPFRVNCNGKHCSSMNMLGTKRQTCDKFTAKDSYVFLINWLERFPQYKSGDFFITGESYAGHYVPQLANTIFERNKQKPRTIINLKGVAIGNPWSWVDDETSKKGVYDYFWTHGLMSDETHEAIDKYCDFASETTSDKCLSFTNKAYQEIGNTNRYNIYAPTCHEASTRNGPPGSVYNYDPCSESYVQVYMNSPEVQRALHALPTNWTHCRHYNWLDSPSSSMPTIKYLIANGNVPITSTKYSFNRLNLTIQVPWRPWYSGNEVGGYVEEYKGVSLVTVRGSGHEVPSWQPERAFTLFASFLNNSLLPSSPSS
ncbi:hypothetical protein K1719_035702 [Acacia pycnantha]|nr:hypothetical protein K1719_035702 [Acacia pycnantha]